ncbi:mitochondrial carrier (BOU / S-adenosylmethionine carrier) [Galdieria sulphuraria]|uniref:Mitochondrial carrier (BOU / S-adenosylmethionine carrier) n=1 Tax=Galdieria sulphuraria TaxID=130081 RepID=M2VWQ6_GALSU|nr:mitochondrial carrier (BOU / S-adenosylmethionine carrier) [Galdieria sulphuraria]EME27681.1 mitochondrial carrier (BOU / S-adenosylmethionine carrier) [Galdieria sulphuraria]|eukprot:XP_005704201.1 mitochondrial carrier (BOU / S-adenosylmethionine carrier) [Galdieria sulphuraria]
MSTDSVDFTLWDHLFAGAIATSAAVSTMHPMDTIKTILQHSQGKNPSFKADLSVDSVLHSRSSALTVAGQLFRKRGISGFYQGLGANVGAQTPAGAIKFAVYGILKQKSERVFDPKWRSFVEFGCAALAFIACSVVLVPGEVVKQRLQSGMYSSMRAGVVETWRARGISGFYAGYGATLLRDIPYTMLEFGLYEQFKRLFRGSYKKDILPPHIEWFLGGLAGGCTGFLTTPFDVLKTHLMTGQHSQGIWPLFHNIVQRDGLSGLFCGGLTRVLWLIPFTAVFFGVHEASKRAMIGLKRHRLFSIHTRSVVGFCQPMKLRKRRTPFFIL